MKGVLITNKYLLSEKFDVLKNGFLNASNDLNISLDYMDNFSAYDLVEKKLMYDFVLFYDKDIKLALLLENQGYRLFNKSSAIKICDDKFLTYIKLKNIIRQPLTMQSPFLYYDDLSNDLDFIDKCENNFKYPMILKETSGSFGQQVYKINNKNELCRLIKNIGVKSFIVQEYIKETFGRDLRIQVVGNKVVAAIQRINKNGDFRANITNGGKAYLYNTNDLQNKMAIEALKLVGADFAGVDILFGENDEPILCEINSNAHIENISRICNINIYKEILKYIIKNV